MKLYTDIPPRLDGTVIYEGATTHYVFQPDDSGRLAADVEDKRDLARALRSGDFYPAHPDDEDAAANVVEGAGVEAEAKPKAKTTGRKKAAAK